MELFPRYWESAEQEVRDASGRTFLLRIWGWSTSSPGRAAAAARQRLSLAVQKVRSGEPGEQYYHRNPVREEVLREIRTPEGTLIGIISRNSYGAQILNTDQILIADVDAPAAKKRRRPRGLGGFFSRSAGQDTEPADRPVLERIEEFARARTHLGVYVYRTAAGFRVLISGVHAPPDSDYAKEILTALASDPLYARLCAVHRNYRARLTPKPWRCGIQALSVQWPWADARAEQDAARWLETYQARSAGYTVCRRIRQGSTAVSPEEQLLLQIHDEAVLGPPDQPLA